MVLVVGHHELGFGDFWPPYPCTMHLFYRIVEILYHRICRIVEFSMLKSHSSLRQPPNERCSSPLAIPVASSGLALIAPCPSGAPGGVSGAQSRGHRPLPALLPTLLSVQPSIRFGFLGCECTLLADSKFFIHRYPQIPLCGAVLTAFSTWSMLIEVWDYPSPGAGPSATAPGVSCRLADPPGPVARGVRGRAAVHAVPGLGAGERDFGAVFQGRSRHHHPLRLGQAALHPPG